MSAKTESGSALPKVLITQSEIQKRVEELGAKIYQDYLETGDALTLICVLKGGFLFCADLAREISKASPSSPKLEVEFISVRSYDGETSVLKQGGELCIELDTRKPIEGKHVLIVEDIVDTGLSMDQLLCRLRARNPASLSVCTLLSKPSRREVPVAIQYCGFSIEDKFVIGFGMDYDEKFRGLPYIGYL